MAGTDFASTNTITVDGKTITFASSGGNTITANGATLDLTGATVGNLLTAIDTITGTSTPSSISAGAITIQTGTASDLTLAGGNANATNAIKSLGFSSGSLSVARTSTPPTGTVIADDEQTFQNESISGGAITAYDSTGTAVNLQLRWAKTDSASLGVGHSNTWNLFYQSNPGATGTQVAWTNAGTSFTFSPAGALTSPATPAITIPNVAVGNQSLGNLSFNVATGSLTQYASTGGTATINSVTQNGYAAGQLQSVAINNNGIVVGTFSNGQNLRSRRGHARALQRH